MLLLLLHSCSLHGDSAELRRQSRRYCQALAASASAFDTTNAARSCISPLIGAVAAGAVRSVKLTGSAGCSCKRHDVRPALLLWLEGGH